MPPIVRVGLPTSTKATGRLLWVRLPTQEILIRDKLTFQPTKALRSIQVAYVLIGTGSHSELAETTKCTNSLETQKSQIKVSASLPFKNCQAKI